MKNLLRIELNPNRIYGLDILRAMAILFVVVGHGENLMPPARYKYVNYFVLDGVSIFFVLSGFLIGGILIKILDKNGLNVPLVLNFWKRRWFRTLPNYFFILFLLFTLNLLFNEDFVLLTKLSYVIFSQNLFYIHPNFFPEAWSLSIEEWFYLLLPLIMLLAIRVFKVSARRALLMTAIGILVVVTLFRYVRYVELDIDSHLLWDKTFRKQVITRLDSLMFGVIGAYVYYYFESYWGRFKKIAFALGIFLFLVVKFNLFRFEALGVYKCVFSFTFISVATLLLLPLLNSIRNGKGMLFRAITYISLISYSMYLINLIVVQKWILGSMDWSYLESVNGYLYLLTRYSLFWFFTIVLSILIYKFYEVPMTSLRDKV